MARVTGQARVTGRVRAVVGSACAVVGILVLAGCSSTHVSVAQPPTPVPTSAATTQGPTPTPTPTATTVAFSALAVGDCLTIPAGSDQVEPATATVVPCALSHTAEVYALPALPGGGFPGDDAATGDATDACTAAFQPYVGVDVYDTQLNFSVYTPSQADWSAGVRHSTCVVFYDGGNTVGSVKGIGAGTPQLAP